MSVLKIVASARLAGSNSRVITDYLTASLKSLEVKTRDLAMDGFPAMSSEDLMGMFANSDETRPSLQEHLGISAMLID